MWHPRVPLGAGDSSGSDFKVLLQRTLLKVQARRVSLPGQGGSSNARSSAAHAASLSASGWRRRVAVPPAALPSSGCLDSRCQWVNKVRSPSKGVNAHSSLLRAEERSFSKPPPHGLTLALHTSPQKTSIGHPKQSRLCCFGTL